MRRLRRKIQQATWHLIDCPQCSLPVAFLFTQRMNTCAFCQMVVWRAME